MPVHIVDIRLLDEVLGRFRCRIVAESHYYHLRRSVLVPLLALNTMPLISLAISLVRPGFLLCLEASRS